MINQLRQETKQNGLKNFVKILMVSLVLLQGVYSQEIEEGVKFLLKSEGFYVVDQLTNEYLLMEMLGEGSVEISLMNKYGTAIKTEVLKELSSSQVSILPIHREQLKHVVKINMKLSDQKPLDKGIMVLIRQSNYVEMVFNQSLSIYPNFTFQVKIQARQSQQITSTDFKVQFTAYQSKFTNFYGDEEFSMLVNHSQNFPNLSQFDLEGQKQIGNNLIAQISPSDKNFCVIQNCIYSISLLTQNINHLYFSLMMIPNNREFTIEKQLDNFDILKSPNKLNYTINLNRQGIEGWWFQIDPFEGNPDMYINIDEKPVKDYEFIADSEGKDNILITQKYALENKLNFNKIFVEVQNSKNYLKSKFILKATQIKVDEFINLQSNRSIHGILSHQEVANFYLSFTKKSSKQPYQFKLKLSQQKSTFLYLKECNPQQNLRECQVTLKDIQKDNNGSLIWRKSTLEFKKSEKIENVINFDFYCNFKNQEIENSELPKSDSCVFMIGVYNPQEKENSKYHLQTDLELKTIIINLRQNKTILIHQGQHRQGMIDLRQEQVEKFKFLNFRLLSIKGQGTVFLSYTNTSPNEKDYDALIEYQSNSGPLKSIQNLQKFLLLKQNEKIYFQIFAKDYSFLEIYSDVSQKSLMGIIEQVKENILLERVLDRSQFYKEEDKIVYYKDFKYKFNEELLKKQKVIKISSYSYQQGLKICVQLVNQVSTHECEKESYSSDMLLNSQNFDFINNDQINVRILTEKKDQDNINQLPIVFYLFLNIGDKHAGQYLFSGNTYNYKIQAQSEYQYFVSFEKIRRNGRLVLEVESEGVVAEIFLNKKNSKMIASLDKNNFCLQINNIQEFKKTNCPSSACVFKIFVKNLQNLATYFQMTFLKDEELLQFYMGKEIALPTNFPTSILVKANEDQPLFFSFVGNSEVNVKSQVYDQETIFTEKFLSQKIQQNFDFALKNSKKGEIVYTIEDFDQYRPPVVIFDFQPIEEVISKNSFTVISQDKKCLVKIHQKMQKLENFQIEQGIVLKDDFVFYNVFMEREYGTVMISVDQGEADLYVNEGINNPPTLSQYSSKSTTYKGDEIVLKKSQENQGFTIGVYGRQLTKFNIIFIPNLKNFIQIKKQKLMNFTLKSNTSYIFELDDFSSPYEILLGSQVDDINVDFYVISEKSGKDLIDQILDKKNLFRKFLILKDQPPLTIPNLTQKLIMRIVTGDQPVELIFAQYDKAEPIEVSRDQSFDFVMDSHQKRIFKYDLQESDIEVMIDISLNYGQIDYQYGSSLDDLSQNQHIEKSTQEIYQNDSSENLQPFNTFYLVINTGEKTASFNIALILTSQFVQIKPFRKNIITHQENEDLYLYFIIDENLSKNLKNVILQITQTENSQENPNLYYLPLSSRKVSHQEILKNFQSMPLIDYKSSPVGNYQQIKITPQVTPGQFIIKFPSRNFSQKLKVELNYNHTKFISLNTFDQDYYSNKNYIFRSYVGETGEFNFSLNVCTSSYNPSIVFQKTYFKESQSLPFQKQTMSSSIEYFDKGIVQEIKYNQEYYHLNLSENGLVSINLDLKNTHKKNIKGIFNSEFKNDQKKLFMREYVQHPQNQSFKIIVDKKQHYLEFLRPDLIDQFYEDHSDIAFLVINFQFKKSLKKNDFFKNFKKCNQNLFDFKLLSNQSFTYPIDDFKKQQNRMVKMLIKDDFKSNQQEQIGLIEMQISFQKDSSQKLEEMDQILEIPLLLFNLEKSSIMQQRVQDKKFWIILIAIFLIVIFLFLLMKLKAHNDLVDVEVDESLKDASQMISVSDSFESLENSHLENKFGGQDEIQEEKDEEINEI